MNGRQPALNHDQVVAIRASDAKYYDLAREYQVSHVTIWKVKKGKPPYEIPTSEVLEVHQVPANGPE